MSLATTVCPACSAPRVERFHLQAGVPVNSCLLLPDPGSAAAVQRGNIELGFCPACGHIANLAFEPHASEYSARYEATQAHSATFRAFQQELANALIERYQLHGRRLVEIGCGQGEFISSLCALGDNEGTGFDPAWRQGSPPYPAGVALRFVADVFDARYGALDCDFLCCNMTLEHIARPAEFLAGVRGALRPGTDVFFMVPDSRRILAECAFEDIYYEHCNYFTPASLKALFLNQGFDELDSATLYNGQYLGIHACVSSGPAIKPGRADLDTLRAWIDSFPSRWADKLAFWRRHLETAAARDKRMVIWGGGSKAVAFLAAVPGSERIEQVVDINPLRQGHYLPDGQRIIAPTDLPRTPPAEVVIMNSIYRDEITASLARLGLKPALSCL